MRTFIALLALSLSMPLSAEAAKKQLPRPNTLVGVWQAILHHDGVMIHSVLQFNRDGTATDDAYLSKNGQSQHNHLDFHWRFHDGVVFRFTPDGNNASAAVLFLSRTRIKLTQIGGDPSLEGVSIEYELQEHQNEGGCRLEATPGTYAAKTDRTDPRTPISKKRKARQLPA